MKCAIALFAMMASSLGAEHGGRNGRYLNVQLMQYLKEIGDMIKPGKYGRGSIIKRDNIHGGVRGRPKCDLMQMCRYPYGVR